MNWLRQRFGERPRRPRIGMAFGDRGRRAAQACEIKLVQQRGIERDQLLALEPIDYVAGRILEIERLKLFRDGVEPPQGTAVVVLVVALDQLDR